MSTASTLSASAMQASRAALSAALSEHKELNESNDATKSANGDDVEEGEIQEVDMESQAEGIRTVFSDPTNFNVKVCLNVVPRLRCPDSTTAHFFVPGYTFDSIHCSHLGLFGSTLLRQKVETCRRHR